MLAFEVAVCISDRRPHCSSIYLSKGGHSQAMSKRNVINRPHLSIQAYTKAEARRTQPLAAGRSTFLLDEGRPCSHNPALTGRLPTGPSYQAPSCCPAGAQACGCLHNVSRRIVQTFMRFFCDTRPQLSYVNVVRDERVSTIEGSLSKGQVSYDQRRRGGITSARELGDMH